MTSKDGTRVSRRHAIRAVAGGAALGVAAPALAQGQPTIRWRLTSSFPKSLEALTLCSTLFADRVAKATEGRFQIQFFAPGEIVGALQALDAVQNGTVECAHTGSYYYVGKDPTFAFACAMPFGLNTRLQHAWLSQPDTKALLDPFFAGYNIVHLPFGNTGAQMGGWFRREINTVADLNGLKFRVGGLAGRVLQKLGVVPQQTAAGDIYPALERGTLDAVEFVGPLDDEKLGFVKVAKFYYAPGWWDPGTATNLFVNKGKWEELPESYKAILASAAAEATAAMIGRYDAENGAALRRLIGQGAQVRLFNREILDASFKATNELYAEIASGNETFRRVLDNWTTFRRETATWFSIAETQLDAYLQSAVRRT